MGITRYARLFFDDKRYTSVLLIAWGVITCTVFYILGAFHTHFMTFGPSEKTVFMGMTINNWSKWHCLAQFSFWNTAVNEFLGSALIPWFTNTIQDQKTKYLPYSKMACIHITNIYCVYTHIMSVFGIFLFFSQVDFLLIRMVADLLVSIVTTMWWCQNKTVDPVKYELEGNGNLGVDKDQEGMYDDESLLVPMEPVGGFGMQLVGNNEEGS